METDVNRIRRLLRFLYYSPESPIAFGSFTAIKKYLRKRFPKVSDAFIKEWLAEQTVHSLHLERKKKFKRNKVFVMRIDENWQCDLVDMQSFSNENDGFKYLLTCIDVFSKRAWVIPLKYKSSQHVIQAFSKLIRDRKPEKLQFDLGKEFNNKYFKDFLKMHNIVHFVAESKLKCVVVERFHRTLKSKMYKYFTANNTRRYIDALQSFVNGYNSSYHSSIKMAPKDVTAENQRNVFFNLYRKELLSGVAPTVDFNIGDRVRVIDFRNVFQKGFKRRWSDEIFTIHNIIRRPLSTMYEIIDYKQRKFNRRFYAEELQKVSAKSKPRIQKIVARRIFGDKEEQLVTLRGYPSMEPQWVPVETLY